MVTSKLNDNLRIISQYWWCFQVSLKRIAYGKWGNNNGQACIAPDYLLVDESIASEVVSHILQRKIVHCAILVSFMHNCF